MAKKCGRKGCSNSNCMMTIKFLRNGETVTDNICDDCFKSLKAYLYGRAMGNDISTYSEIVIMSMVTKFLHSVPIKDDPRPHIDKVLDNITTGLQPNTFPRSLCQVVEP